MPPRLLKEENKPLRRVPPRLLKEEKDTSAQSTPPWYTPLLPGYVSLLPPGYMPLSYHARCGTGYVPVVPGVRSGGVLGSRGESSLGEREREAKRAKSVKDVKDSAQSLLGSSASERMSDRIARG